MMLSVIIPAHNEEGHVANTACSVMRVLLEEGVAHEVIVVDDHSSDQTADRVRAVQAACPTVRLVTNEGPRGFGFAVRKGLSVYAGDAVVMVMADGSDEPRDVVTYYRKLLEGYDCVFGSRFIRGAQVMDYPWLKWCLNRLGNLFIRLLLGIPHNDLTNAFKGYRRAVIDGVQPLLSSHFNLTVELPLKAVVRGYSYATVPVQWYQRQRGVTKFQIQEMGSRYFFIVLYCFLEKHLARRDYHRDVTKPRKPAEELPSATALDVTMREER